MWGTPDDPYPEHTIAWLLIYLQAMGGSSVECSECGRAILRAVDESVYHCPCGFDL